MTFPVSRAHRQSSFGPSFMVLSRRKREAMKRVYAVCRAMDDISDEPGTDPEKKSRLEQWRLEIGRCYAGRPTLNLTRSLLGPIREFGIKRKYFEDLLSGVEMDLATNRYPDFNHLSTYCYRVAGTVGLICLPIFGYPEEEGREYALSLGTAFQLTNILRDVREDAVRGRIYIPQEELRQFGYSEKELLGSVYNSSFLSLMKFQVDRAAGFYKKASEAIRPGYRNRLLAPEIMASVYFALLREIKRKKFNVFAGRVRISGIRKAFLVSQTILYNRLRISGATTL